MNDSSTRNAHYYFITGRLAESALSAIVCEAAKNLGFRYTIGVMPISVAALITSRWLPRHWQVPDDATEIILPGYCDQGLSELQSQVAVPIRCGPRDLRDLPHFLGGKNIFSVGIEKYSISILAEINHAPRLSREALMCAARRLANEGADVIDLGCDPSSQWIDVGDAVRALRDEIGVRVSIDTFDPVEAQQACHAGAELVLSVNSTNRNAALDFGAEVVAIPDTPDDLSSLDETLEYLIHRQIPCRADPILEPIGCGFMASLERYAQVRRKYPDLSMLMGIGNLTELTDVDSAGVNLLLISICEELRIHSVLTTQVINWARSSVRECAAARKLAHFAISQGVPPKNISDALVRLRDPRLNQFPTDVFEQMSTAIRDHNYRIFAQDDSIHVVTAGVHLSDTDPYSLFERLLQEPGGERIDQSHAFYLGFELAKAVTALTLGKQYEQDEALRWGDLTRPEKHHRLPRKRASEPTEPTRDDPDLE